MGGVAPVPQNPRERPERAEHQGRIAGGSDDKAEAGTQLPAVHDREERASQALQVLREQGPYDPQRLPLQGDWRRGAEPLCHRGRIRLRQMAVQRGAGAVSYESKKYQTRIF